MIKMCDKLGYVGKTGETDIWHLHLTVMTEKGLENQQNDPGWMALSKKSKYTQLKGQVDPLNESEAGTIANLLNQYTRID